MATNTPAKPVSHDRLSPWWPRSVIAVMIIGFSILIMLTIKVHYDAPPIPDQVVDPGGSVLFTKEDIQTGQEVFLKHGLMDNGSIWGHGGYLGPDFSAQYLHNLAIHVAQMLAAERHGRPFDDLSTEDRVAVEALVRSELKENRFDPASATLTFTDGEAESYRRQIDWWADYFAEPAGNGGLPAQFISHGDELNDLTALLRRAMERAQSHRVARRHRAGSARFRQVRLSRLEIDRRSCRVEARTRQPRSESAGRDEILRHRGVVVPGADVSRGRHRPLSRRSRELLRIRYFRVSAEQHSAQLASAVGDLLDCNRLWALLLASELGEREPKRQATFINMLFGALVVVAVGSLLGQWAGTFQWLPESWFWFGQQGWEYLELGMLAIALLVFSVRHVSTEPEWNRLERYFKVSFWA